MREDASRCADYRIAVAACRLCLSFACRQEAMADTAARFATRFALAERTLAMAFYFGTRFAIIFISMS